MKLLVADDEEYTLNGIVERLDLAELGISDIETAGDGAEGLEKAIAFPPDIVLTDVRMPHLDGVTMVQRIRAAHPGVKVIFMSGYADKAYLKAAIEIGALRYIEKPVDMKEIVEAIHTAVDRLRAEQAKNAMLGATRELTEAELARCLSEEPYDEAAVADLINLTGVELSQSTTIITTLFRVGLGGPPAEPSGASDVEGFVRHLRIRLRRSPFHALISIRPRRIVAAHFTSRSREDHKPTQAAVARFVQRFLSERETPFVATAGVGVPVAGPGAAALSLAAASQALDVAFFGPFGAVVQHRASATASRPLDESIVAEYARHLETEDSTVAASIVHRLADDMCRSPYPAVSEVRALFRKLLVRLMVLRDEKRIRFGPEENAELLWPSVDDGGTATEIAAYVCSETARVLGKIDRTRRPDRIVSKVKRFILDNYADPTTGVDSIARAVDLSPAYLCTRFKAGTGTTINRYLTEVRLAHAKEMLADPRGPKISQVATKAGWSNADYFARVFRKETARSPSEFRELSSR